MVGSFTLFIPSLVILFFPSVVLLFIPFCLRRSPVVGARSKVGCCRAEGWRSGENERQGYFNENPTRLRRHLVPSATSNERPCKYYFCLCTCQLRMTLALINNAKQPGLRELKSPHRRARVPQLHFGCFLFSYLHWSGNIDHINPFVANKGRPVQKNSEQSGASRFSLQQSRKLTNDVSSISRPNQEPF